MRDDEFKNYDAKAHWAAINNDGPVQSLPQATIQTIEDMISFLQQERTFEEIRKRFSTSPQETTKLLISIRGIKGVTTERSDVKGKFAYKVVDFRR